jgi:hypothetical protein
LTSLDLHLGLLAKKVKPSKMKTIFVMDKQAILGIIGFSVLTGIGIIFLLHFSFVQGDYRVEDFNPSYQTVNSSGYMTYIEDNRSNVDSNATVLEVKTIYEEEYGELSSIMGQFGNPDLDGGPHQDWTPSINMRTRTAIEEHDYIKYEGYFYNVSYEGPENLPSDAVSFDAKLFDDTATPGNRAIMQLELKVTAEDNVSIRTGAPYPFQALYASNEDNRLCIWSVTYLESDHVSDGYCDGSGMVNAIGLGREHRPGEVVKRNYSIRSQDVEATGEYLIEEDMDYTLNETERTLQYQIKFNLTKLHSE